MFRLTDYPVLVFFVAFAALWAASKIGSFINAKWPAADGSAREYFSLIEAGTLTLLGLIIAFTFSMATSRYDQRKNLEEEEANAIGTEYVRADFLPVEDAAKVRTLLRAYLDQRIANYTTRDEDKLKDIRARTEQLHEALWIAVRDPAKSQPSPLTSLAAAGMNDVINSEGYTQAAWWNRIPRAAWGLMLIIAFGCNILLGYGLRDSRQTPLLSLILPFFLAIALALIADLDSPRGGIIRLAPQNLQVLAESLARPAGTTAP